MSLLSNIINDIDASVDAKKLAYLLIIIKRLGWESFKDTRVIKPFLRKTELYLRKHAKVLNQIFQIDFSTLKRDDIVDTLNPLLIHIWQTQIIGDTSAASLELLLPVK